MPVSLRHPVLVHFLSLSYTHTISLSLFRFMSRPPPLSVLFSLRFSLSLPPSLPPCLPPSLSVARIRVKLYVHSCRVHIQLEIHQFWYKQFWKKSNIFCKAHVLFFHYYMHTYVRTYTHTYSNTQAHTSTHTHLHTCTHACTHTQWRTHTNARTLTHTRAHTHTPTRTLQYALKRFTISEFANMI